jgi:CheY-like chemotaxis protein
MGQHMISHRILVVDDNRDAADTIAELLGAYGHATATAYGGREALAASLVFAPEIVFLDIGMPGMDGYETAAELRRLEGCAPRRIVALTAWNDAQARARIAAAGFDIHLTKPAPLQSLLNATQDLPVILPRT